MNKNEATIFGEITGNDMFSSDDLQKKYGKKK